MGTITITIQLLLALSILVILHELGHFIPARLFKIRVEKFYLFFNPWFSLFKYKKGDTENGIGWLPLGGFVKISGMIDESMDTEQMKLPPKPYEFRSKPAWQRLIVMIGGVTVNILLAVVIYGMIAFFWGRNYLPNNELKHGLAAHELFEEIGFRDGDKILTIDGDIAESSLEVEKYILLRGAKEIGVIHENGKQETIIIPEGFEYKIFEKGIMGTGLSPRFLMPTYIDSILPKSNAEKADLLKGDKIIAVNEEPLTYFDEFKNLLFEKKNQEITLTLLRESDTITKKATVTEDGTLGFAPYLQDQQFNIGTLHYSFWQAIPIGVKDGYNTLADYVGQMKFLFTKKGASQLGGFGTIAQIFPTSWDWKIFWNRTAFLSVILAFMNILPIPALDGGHVVFLLYEMIAGRPPSDKFLEKAQMIGILLLLSLMLYANGNDFFRWISE